MKIILALALLTADPQVPDIRHQVDEPDIQTCMADAADFMSHAVPDIEGINGMAAQCVVLLEGVKG